MRTSLFPKGVGGSPFLSSRLLKLHPMPTDRLTQRQRLFAEAVAQGRSQIEAAHLAGYSGKNRASAASLLAHLPKVQNEISRVRSSIERTKEFTVNWWRGELRDLLDDCRNAEDLPTRARALEMAGRHIGALDPQQQVSPQVAQLFVALADAARAGTLPALPSAERAAVSADTVTVEDTRTRTREGVIIDQDLHEQECFPGEGGAG